MKFLKYPIRQRLRRLIISCTAWKYAYGVTTEPPPDPFGRMCVTMNNNTYPFFLQQPLLQVYVYMNLLPLVVIMNPSQKFFYAILFLYFVFSLFYLY